MRPSPRRCRIVLIAAASSCLAAGCVAESGYVGGTQYEGGATVGYGVDFYQPYGYEYGCCAGYWVGPPRHDFGRDENREHDGDGYRDHDRGHDYGRPQESRPQQYGQARPSQPQYRPAPASRPAPSIPTGPRGGASHPGGHGRSDKP